jgi:GNAT superfamily N-acetyltransferase
MSAIRPAAVSLRPPTRDDAPSVLDLLLACARTQGRAQTTLEELRAEWSAPGFDLAADAWVAEADGVLCGFASLHGDDLEVAVHPDATARGVGTALREAGERRAQECGTRVLRQFVPVADTDARVHLLDAGWWPVHHYFRVRAPLTQPPEQPDVVVRAFDPAADLEPVWHLVQSCYTGHEGFLPQTLEGWRATTLDKPGFDPSLWLVLHDAVGLAGVALGERAPRSTGLVHTLAVVERARGRGHGRALLLQLLEAFRAAGLRGAEAAVHGPTAAAAALFESAGMTVRWHAERWEKTLGR